MKVYSIGYHIRYSEATLKGLSDLGTFKHFDEFPDETKMIQHCKDADVLISWGEPTVRVIDELQNLKLFVYMFSGYDGLVKNEDLMATLVEKGIKVAYTPKYSTEAVAQFLVSAVLSINRKLIKGNYSQQANPYSHFLSKDIRDCKIGIVGYGNIGASFANKCFHLGAQVAGYSRNELIKMPDIPITFTSLEALFEDSDFICVCLDLNKETHRLIDEQLLKRVKKGSTIISIARKEIFCTEALNAFLINNPSNTVLIDDEDVGFDEFENLISTPHIAFNTERSLYNCTDTVYFNIRKFLHQKEFFEIEYPDLQTITA